MEEQIKALLKQRDPQTVGRFYDQYAPSIYGMIKSCTPLPADPDKLLYHSFQNFFDAAASRDLTNERLFICLYKITRETIKEYSQ